jgi:hypothetical protein
VRVDHGMHGAPPLPFFTSCITPKNAMSMACVDWLRNKLPQYVHPLTLLSTCYALELLVLWELIKVLAFGIWALF